MAVHINTQDDTNNKEQHQLEKPKPKPEDEEEEEYEDEDDYIDMEVMSTFTTEFEFQMSSLSSDDRDSKSTTSPADELFYMGKLLPLHLPPRLQMFQNINTEIYSTPLGTTPFESCNISPTESCQVSTELNPEEYFRHFVSPDQYSKGYFVDNNDNSNNSPKKSWTKKLKTKIKALFGRTADLRSKEVQKINPCEKEGKICHRRSFSGAFKRARPSSKTKLASTCALSTTSSSSQEIQALKRSSSASSEIESSLIQGAIAHCKKSQRTRKTLSEIGFHSFSSTRFAANFDDQNREMGLCRG